MRVIVIVFRRCPPPILLCHQGSRCTIIEKGEYIMNSGELLSGEKPAQSDIPSIVTSEMRVTGRPVDEVVVNDEVGGQQRMSVSELIAAHASTSGPAAEDDDSGSLPREMSLVPADPNKQRYIGRLSFKEAHPHRAKIAELFVWFGSLALDSARTALGRLGDRARGSND
jgi:hypothetical protein